MGEKKKGYELLVKAKARAGVGHLLTTLGEDVHRQGLVDTPARFVKSMLEQTWGLRIPEEDFLKSITRSFDVGYDQMVSVGGIWFTSLCEHHLAPFYGHATVAYIPKCDDQGRAAVLGLSKLARLVRYYAARPQVQERMTKQIAGGLEKILKDPVGIGVRVVAEHTCMTTRGVRAPGAVTITTDLRGALREDPKARAEFLDISRGK